MRESRREKMLREEPQPQQKQIATMDDMLTLLLGNKPNPTQRQFCFDPDELKAFMGPAGSAKTTAGCAAVLLRGLFMPGSKWIIGRQDYNKLMNTTFEAFTRMIQRLPPGLKVEQDKTPPMRLWFNSVNGGQPFQITFMGLKDNLGSFEANGAFVDEADELERSKIFELLTRLRYPGGHRALMLAFNPPDTTHWLYEECTGMNDRGEQIKDPSFKLYTPLRRENEKNLPAGYYDLLSSKLLEDEKRRLVDGDWGSAFKGMPVYRQFHANLHAGKPLRYAPADKTYCFWDFGYAHPFFIVAQLDWMGRLLILHERMGSNLEIEPFATLCLQDLGDKFPGVHRVEHIGDVAVKQRRDTGSALTRLAKLGISMRTRGMRIDVSIRTVRMKLEQLVEGEPALQVDPVSCPILVRALRGGYHMDVDGAEPVKDGFYDHGMDALRYGVCNVFGISDTARPNGQQAASLEYSRAADTARRIQQGRRPMSVREFYSRGYDQ